jgi:two-component system, cell cycle sensor histidine kinase and response regulator CckA
VENQDIPYCNCLEIKIHFKKMSGPILEDEQKMILLAEDNDDVREGVKEILEAEGYEVIEAIDGEDAVSKFMGKDSMTKICLLILDVGMPKKNGREVYDLIRKVSPEVKVLFTSGHESAVIERKGVAANGAHFIIKPFSPPVLLGKVREILHGIPPVTAVSL